MTSNVDEIEILLVALTGVVCKKYIIDSVILSSNIDFSFPCQLESYTFM